MLENDILNKSTIDHPISFFEYFFLRGGFQKFHREFFQVQYDEEDGSKGDPIGFGIIEEVNKEVEYISGKDIYSGEFVKKYFRNELKQHLLAQVHNSKSLIYERIQSISLKEKKVVFFLKDTISNLNYLASIVKSSIQLSNYEINTEVLYFMINLLQKRYDLFFTKIDSSCIKEASDVIILDVDGIDSEEEYDQIFSKVCSFKTTLGGFRSPSGNGLKILIPTSSGIENFDCAFNQVAEFYKSELGDKIDYSGKDISRLCFFSYDPNLYQNFNCEIFQIRPCPETTENDSDIQELPQLVTNKKEIIALFEKQVQHTEKLIHYKSGSRNNFILQLACNCCRVGIPEEHAQKLITSNFKGNKYETNSTIKSAYKNVTNSKENNQIKNQLFSINLLNFSKYKPDIECDKRILFEALLIKMLYFKGTFYYSKNRILRELGLKRTKVERLIQDFIDIGYIQKQVKSSRHEGNPRQITYYTVIPENVVRTAQLLYKDSKDFEQRIIPILKRFKVSEQE